VRPSWLRLFSRFLDGPAISVSVHDASGRPLLAAVSIEELVTHEGEIWRSRCRDGRHDRYLPAPGHYTLLVKAEGQAEPVRQPIDVPAGRTQIDIVVPEAAPTAQCPRAL
jgi:hypothetical protein